MSIKLKNVVLIQGVFRADFFSLLKKSKKDVVVLEGRPSLQAARENCLQLQKMGMTPTLMADNMAGYLFSKAMVKEVWIASQSIDKNGAMCDIGALVVAILAKKHDIPVFTYFAGRTSKPFGKSSDLQKFNGQSVVTAKVKAFVPLIEWVPAKYINKGKTYE
jgi:methylthioribose-1-phosphate isomerase